MYKCYRCNSTFKSQRGLTQHATTSLVPCDLFCVRCCVKSSNRKAYDKHILAGCVPKIVLSSEEDAPAINASIVINGDHNNNNSVNVQVLNQEFKVAVGEINTVYINKYGIVPHGMEENNLYQLNAQQMYKLIISFLGRYPDNNYTDESLHKLLIQIIQLLYSNEQNPQYMNIIDTSSSNGHNKLYSGKAFIDDKMPKRERNSKITMSFIDMLERISTTKNVNKGVVDFITKVFIPHIRIAAYTGMYHPTFQEAWQLNNTFVKKLKVESLPAHALELTHSDMMDQYNQFLLKAEATSGLYVKNYIDNLNAKHSTVVDAQRNQYMALEDLDLGESELEPANDNAQDHEESQPSSIEEPAEVGENTSAFEQKKLEKIEEIKRSAGMSKKRDL